MVDSKFKLLKIIFIITIVFISVILLKIVPALTYYNASNTYDDINYKECFYEQRDSFESMKDRVLSLKKKYDTDTVELWLNYPYNNDYFKIEEKQINLTAKEIEWVKNISKACGTETLSRIIYEDERILFGMEGNHYAFVYTTTGEKPTYMSVPDEYWKWKRKYLESGWYYFRAQ